MLSRAGGLVPFFAGNVLLGSGLFFHAFLYNFYLAGLGLDESVMGLAAASLTAGGLVALLPAGRLVDRLGVRMVLVSGTLCAGLGLTAGAVVERPVTVYAAAFVAGMGAVTWRVSMGPYIMAWTAAAQRSRVFSWNVALLVGSGAVWMITGGALAEWLQAGSTFGPVEAHRVTLLGGAGLTILAIPLFVIACRGRPAAGPAHASDSVDTVSGVNSRLEPLAPSVVAVAFWMLGPALVLPFFNIFFSREYQLDVTLIGTVFGIAHLATALVMVGSGELAGRLGPRRVLAAWTAVFPPVLWMLAAVGSVELAIGLYFVQGAVSPATNPLIEEILLSRARPSQRGAVSSWRNAATEIAGIVGAGAGGVVLRQSSFDLLFVLAGSVGLIAGLALWLVLRRHARG
jgi:MFS family permease